MHIIGNLRNGLVRMAKLYLYAHNDGTVYPFLGGDAACLSDYAAKITFCDAHLIGIERKEMFTCSILNYEIYETVEDVLLS